MSALSHAARGSRGALRVTRGMSSSAAPTPGPRLPEGNDPAAYHSRTHAVADSGRWALISAVFALPVTAFGVIQAMNKHEHAPAPVQYSYMRRASRVPRFPWGVRYACPAVFRFLRLCVNESCAWLATFVPLVLTSFFLNDFAGGFVG
jgi:hypothetical protein